MAFGEQTQLAGVVWEPAPLGNVQKRTRRGLFAQSHIVNMHLSRFERLANFAIEKHERLRAKAGVLSQQLEHTMRGLARRVQSWRREVTRTSQSQVPSFIADDLLPVPQVSSQGACWIVTVQRPSGSSPPIELWIATHRSAAAAREAVKTAALAADAEIAVHPVASEALACQLGLGVEEVKCFF